jgi:hypothetical protein
MGDVARPNQRLQRQPLRAWLLAECGFVHHRGVPRVCKSSGVPLRRGVRPAIALEEESR